MSIIQVHDGLDHVLFVLERTPDPMRLTLLPFISAIKNPTITKSAPRPDCVSRALLLPHGRTKKTKHRSSSQILPYIGEVTVSCAPATTPTLDPSSSPAPTDGLTRMPVGQTEPPAESSASTTDEESTGSKTAAIAGGVGGGLSALLLVAAVAYKVKGRAGGAAVAAPPSYDDLVGRT